MREKTIIPETSSKEPAISASCSRSPARGLRLAQILLAGALALLPAALFAQSPFGVGGTEVTLQDDTAAADFETIVVGEDPKTLAEGSTLTSSGTAVFQSTSSTNDTHIIRGQSNSGSLLFALTQQGRVGIGGHPVSGLLDVAGEIYHSGASYFDGSCSNTNGSGWAVGNPSSFSGIGCDASNGLKFDTYNTDSAFQRSLGLSRDGVATFRSKGAGTQVSFIEGASGNATNAFGSTSDDNGFHYVLSGGAAVHQLLTNQPSILNAQQGAVADLAIYGDTNQEFVFFDVASERLGLGTNTPAQKLDIVGSVAMSGSIVERTGDGSDNASFSISGGGDLGSNRGAYATLYGNEHATQAGDAEIVLGNAADAQFRVRDGTNGDADMFTVTDGGKVAINASLAENTNATLYVNGGVALSSVTVIVPDNGNGGTAAAGTIDTSASFVVVECNDSNGCNMTMGETNAYHGQILYITFTTGASCNFSDTAGVSELSAAHSIDAYDTLTLLYARDRWVEVSVSNN